MALSDVVMNKRKIVCIISVLHCGSRNCQYAIVCHKVGNFAVNALRKINKILRSSLFLVDGSLPSP